MTEPEVFDVVVIGAGPAGENIAQYATQHTDLTAALIERELVGGECSYYACMPSKALLRPIEIAATSAHLSGVTPATLDRNALLARRDLWVSRYDDSGQVKWADGAGLKVLRGSGRLVGERLVSVETADRPRTIEARHTVVIATGSEPVVPDMYAECAPWGSRDATGVVEVPDRLVIVGGGVVACEAAVWMSALGSSVTLLSRDDRLLTRVEPFATFSASAGASCTSPFGSRSIRRASLPRGSMLVSDIPALVAFAVPGITAWIFGRRAQRAGDQRGAVPAWIGLTVSVGFALLGAAAALPSM